MQQPDCEAPGEAVARSSLNWAVLSQFQLQVNWSAAVPTLPIFDCGSAITRTCATAELLPPYHATRFTGHYFFRMLIATNPARDQTRELFVRLDINQRDVASNGVAGKDWTQKLESQLARNEV